MARSEKRRTKKLEAQRKKRSQKKRQLAVQNATSPGNVMKAAGHWLVIAARVTDDGGGGGLRNALIGRKGPAGQIAAVSFLVDTDCLGVKDVLLFTGSNAKWNDLKERVGQNTPMVDVPPEHVCKFVRESVAFAKSFGLPPHKDYAKASAIFGDLDPDDCLTEFTFGRDGKPMFIAGPYDTPARCQRITQTLRQHAGDGNFDVVVPIHESALAGIPYADDEFDDADDDDWDDDD